jgi:hypothetical protein
MTEKKVKKYGTAVTNWLARLERTGESRDPKVLVRIAKNSKRGPATPEARARISAASKRTAATPEFKERIRKANENRIWSPESRAKLSESLKRAYAEKQRHKK